MTINSKQLKILILSIALFIVIGLYPPWIYTFNAKSIHSEKPAEYALIIEPPEPEDYNNVRYGVRMDISRLVVQWLILCAATTGAMLLTREKRK